jgi:DNA-binding transcriptional LysR family regulator
MDRAFGDLDWSLVPSFLAVAEMGSLSGAARRLNASQPTLGRHIKALESHLNAELFQRHARGLQLTEVGHQIFEHAQAMQQAMHALSTTGAGTQTQLKGTVRLACSVFMAHHVLPKIIATIRENEPAIQIDLIASDASENLLFREADIAVRMYRPTQLDMVTQHLGDIALGMFASQAYLARRGRPKSAADLQHHDLVGYDADDTIIREMRHLGVAVTRDWFAVRCDNQSAYWELVKSGCGLGFCQKNVALQTVGIEQVNVDFPLPMLPVWLTVHENLRHTPRIARVWALLQSGLQGLPD